MIVETEGDLKVYANQICDMLEGCERCEGLH